MLPHHQVVIVKSKNYKNIVMKVAGWGKCYEPVETDDITIKHIKGDLFYLESNTPQICDRYTRNRYELSDQFNSVEELIDSVIKGS